MSPMTTREQELNESAARYGYRIATGDEAKEALARHHEKMSRIFTRMGHDENAVAAQRVADRVRAQKS